MLFKSAAILLLAGKANGFGPHRFRRPTLATSKPTPATVVRSPLFRQIVRHSDAEGEETNCQVPSLFRKALDRFDTISSAGLDDVKVSGLFQKVKDAHNPKTYLVLALLAGLKYKWCFRSPYFWFAVGFCIKWYRARYVFKIPVWDRQPNWNNIITSKEQEKDLKAFTCKKCGSTLFIAKTREFFFEGDTGIGGLGCFSCGAKGKENFTMDRDRIVEDVGDMDDYFDYERPLDFVSRAERRSILKETGGDEEAANQLLMERSGGGSTSTSETAQDSSSAATNGELAAETTPANAEEDLIVDAVPEDDTSVGDGSTAEGSNEEDDFALGVESKSQDGRDIGGARAEIVNEEESSSAENDDSTKANQAGDLPKDEAEAPPMKVKKQNKTQSSPPAQDDGSLDDLDALGMDG